MAVSKDNIQIPAKATKKKGKKPKKGKLTSLM